MNGCRQRVIRSVAVLSAFVLLGTACTHRRAPVQSPPDPLERVPVDWIDLPGSPFVARMVGAEAVLLNRSSKTFSGVTVGCVLEKGGKVVVAHSLFSISIFDSAFTPGSTVTRVLRDVNNLDWFVANQRGLFGFTDVLKPCPEGARTAVTAAVGRDVMDWSAAGTSWPRE